MHNRRLYIFVGSLACLSTCIDNKYGYPPLFEVLNRSYGFFRLTRCDNLTNPSLESKDLYCRGFMSGITQNANCYAICRYNLLTTDFLKPNFNDVCILCETSSMLRNNGDSRKNKSGDLILSRSGAHSTRHFRIVTVCNQNCANRVFTQEDMLLIDLRFWLK